MFFDMMSFWLLITCNHLSAQQTNFIPWPGLAGYGQQYQSTHMAADCFFTKTFIIGLGKLKKGKTIRVPMLVHGKIIVLAAGVESVVTHPKIYGIGRLEGVALSPDNKDSTSDVYTSKVIERPKVIYNKKTGKFVMWLHLDNEDYSYAHSGVAVSDSACGALSIGKKRKAQWQ